LKEVFPMERYEDMEDTARGLLAPVND